MPDITFITGSTLGSAEYVAEHLAEKLKMQNYTCNILHGPERGELSPHGTWIIVTSTHGAGEVPDNLQALIDDLRENKPDLSQLRYGAIGIGNREYDLFCGAIDIVIDVLDHCGAKLLGAPLKIDVLEHEIPEDPAEAWLEQWQDYLK